MNEEQSTRGNPFEAAATRSVKVADIAALPTLQVRKEYVHWPTVSSYATRIRTGADLGPIWVASIPRQDKALRKAFSTKAKDHHFGGPVLVVVDGFHRLEAHRELGCIHIQAKVAECGLSEARWLGGQQNIAHGRALRKADYRRLFQAYMTARRYREKDADSGEWSPRSLREIVKDLGGGMAPSTVREWLLKDYPHLYRAYWLDEERTHQGEMPEGSPGPTEADTIAAEILGYAKLATALPRTGAHAVAEALAFTEAAFRKAAEGNRK